MGQGKYDVEVNNWQEFGFSRFKPALSGYLLALGAVSVTAGMIHDTLSATMVATLDVAAKLGGAAVKQVGYDTVLIRP
jgi:hypothetical protein